MEPRKRWMKKERPEGKDGCLNIYWCLCHWRVECVTPVWSLVLSSTGIYHFYWYFSPALAEDRWMYSLNSIPCTWHRFDWRCSSMEAYVLYSNQVNGSFRRGCYYEVETELVRMETNDDFFSREKRFLFCFPFTWFEQ